MAVDLVTRPGCSVRYLPGVLTTSEAAALFHRLRSFSWRRECDDFGPQSRETLYVGDPGCVFSYVGLRLNPRRWPAAVARVRHRIAEAVGVDPALLSGTLIRSTKPNTC